MITKKVNTVFISQMVEEQAWKALSENFLWTEALLEKYQDEVNWNRVSYNSRILWTVPMLDRFKERINWNILSGSENKTAFSFDNLEQYKNYWDWITLSESQALNFSYEIIDRFVDRWNWNRLIHNHHAKNCVPFNEFFLNRYSDFIPMSAFHDSYLESCMVEEQTEKLSAMILRKSADG